MVSGSNGIQQIPKAMINGINFQFQNAMKTTVAKAKPNQPERE